MKEIISIIVLININSKRLDWHCYDRTDIIVLDNREDYFFSKLNTTCNPNICPSDKSVCSQDNSQCICKKGYAIYPLSTNKCNYKQISRLLILLLEIFIPIGIGHFIVGKTKLGLIKLFLSITPWTLEILGEFKVLRIKYYQGKLGLILSIILFCSSLTYFILYIVDIFYIGIFRDLRDANCVPLENIFN